VNSHCVLTSDGKADQDARIVTSQSLQVNYFSGLPIGHSFPYTEVALSAHGNPDIICVGSLDLVSQKLRDRLEAEGVNAEFLPVEVTEKGGRSSKRYYELNLLTMLACLDQARSRFTEFPIEAGGGLFRIHELHIDQSRAGNSSAFILKEKPMVIVRHDVAMRLQSLGFVGLKLKQLPTGPF